MRFKDKTVVITGSGAGIGKAAAIMFAREGANVVVNSMGNSGEAVLAELKENGYPAIFVQADVSVAEGAEKLISAAVLLRQLMCWSSSMFEFILRRTAYSLLIVLGVLILTFLLFNVGAGDPAGAVLGKNASASEIESLRRRLGDRKSVV